MNIFERIFKREKNPSQEDFEEYQHQLDLDKTEEKYSNDDEDWEDSENWEKIELRHKKNQKRNLSSFYDKNSFGFSSFDKIFSYSLIFMIFTKLIGLNLFPFISMISLIFIGLGYLIYKLFELLREDENN